MQNRPNPVETFAAEAEEWSERPSDHHIEADTSLVGRELRTLKHGDAFAVLDPFGDIGAGVPAGRLGSEGLYFRDTRFLSHQELRIEGRRPLLLGSAIDDRDASLSVDFTNPDLHFADGTHLPRDTIAIERTCFLFEGTSYQRIGLRNYDQRAWRFTVELSADADFVDLFEVRGMARGKHGRRKARRIDGSSVAFDYAGLDGVARTTRLAFVPQPDRLEPHLARFEISLPAGGRASILASVRCEEGAQTPAAGFAQAYRAAHREARSNVAGIARIESSNELFDEVASRAVSDLYTLATRTEHGLYPYAGIPWYSTVFGRDAIITALMTLWLDPTLARGVLRFLAATQATSVDPTADAQPGKILHERRLGEMARLGEVPFRFYYGSVDATPLFVVLAGAYADRTGDRETIAVIWPNILAALDWIDTYGDRDGDGFVEYQRDTDNGLVNQGWKDSHDSIFHADGGMASGPIALVEVQSYVYGARCAAARLARLLGDTARGEALEAAAESLKTRFDTAFWCEDIGTYAIALDGTKAPCRVRTSNAGHALLTGIALPERAAQVAATLLGRASSSGWGIRTVAQGEARFNPMSYHNGSVWPHDNAIIALGFGRYGLKQAAASLLEALFDAAVYQEARRLPELYCGFTRVRHRGPTAYPVACVPQAWAAATPFALLSAALGLGLSFADNEVRFDRPALPRFLDEVVLRNLGLGRSRMDVRLARHGSDVTASVLSRQGDASLVLRS